MGKQVVTIGNVVDDVLNDLGIYSEENYVRYSQFAIRGVTRLSLLHLNSFKTVTLPITAINTVNLPNDYIDYVRIAICLDGREWSLTKNDKICIPEDGECSTEQGNEGYDEVVGQSPSYGEGGGYNIAYYRIDKQRNRIVLQKTYAGAEIKLSYVSNGINYDSETLLPVVASEALIAFIHWKSVQHDATIPMNTKLEYKSEYLREAAILRNLEYNYTIDEIKDTIYSTYSQTVKR